MTKHTVTPKANGVARRLAMEYPYEHGSLVEMVMQVEGLLGFRADADALYPKCEEVVKLAFADNILLEEAFRSFKGRGESKKGKANKRDSSMAKLAAKAADNAQVKKNLDRDISELNLPRRFSYRLRDTGIKTIRELVQKTEHEMLRYSKFGRSSLAKIKRILDNMGLAFGMDLDENGLPIIESFVATPKKRKRVTIGEVRENCEARIAELKTEHGKEIAFEKNGFRILKEAYDELYESMEKEVRFRDSAAKYTRALEERFGCAILTAENLAKALAALAERGRA